MGYKYCKQRRLFLANSSKTLGLISAANLFSYKAFAAPALPKKNIVSIFFLHTGNIPKSGKGGYERGRFHLGEGSSLPNLTDYKNDTIFIRGVDQSVSGNNRGGIQHDDNAGAVFTAHEVPNKTGNAKDLIDGDPDSGNSIDILIGKFLKNKYPETRHPYLLMSQGNKTGSNEEKNGVIRYRTSSIERTGNNKTEARPPIINPRDVYQNIKDSEDCAQNSQSGQNNTADKAVKIARINQDNNRLNIVNENLKQFKSKYLMPGEEYDKLEARVGEKIESNKERIKAINEDREVVVTCGDIPEPNRSHNFNNQKNSGYDKVRKHCQAHFDLMAYAFKYNHTRSATIYPGDWSSDKKTAMAKYPGKDTPLGSMHGAAGHGYINNPMAMLYHERLSEIINDLINTLKRAGVYEDTMIIVAGEFADQDGGGNAHRSDNSPWFIINSGAPAVDHNLGKTDMIHIGDVHLAIMHRMGMTHKTKWGTNNFGRNKKLDKVYETGRRRGDTRLVSVLNGSS